MSRDWVSDVAAMHRKFGFKDKMRTMSVETMQEYLDFRWGCLREEVDEHEDALFLKDGDKLIDSIVDMIVFGIGTLDLYGVNAYKAWDAVHEANMAKVAGMNPTRPNVYGFPDLMKPEGWKSPSHKDNLGNVQLALGFDYPEETPDGSF